MKYIVEIADNLSSDYLEDIIDEHCIGQVHVSRYQEPIDENKLSELARDYVLTMSATMGYFNTPEKIPDELKLCIDMFKAGYHKAKIEK